MNKEKKIRAVIVEDEEPARALVKHFLSSHLNIELLGECSDGFSGLKTIQELKPDLIFLDVQMPKLTGFELLEVLDPKPEVVFTTAFDEYAIKAFELNAVDYLLKPFSQERFDISINKVIEKLSGGETPENRIDSISEKRPEGSPPLTRVVVKKGSSISFIPVSAINYIESEDDYVMIWHSEGKALKQKTMKYYEEALPYDNFARIHRTCIVAIEQIDKIEPYGKDTHRAILKNGKSLPVSRSGYKTLMGKLSS
jgi:two-component system LytT family response regulator